MAVIYEKLVEEDLNRGNGSVTVTNPAGGTLAGSKIGIHSFLGAARLYAEDFAGADIGAKVNAAIAAFPTNTVGIIYLPAGVHSFSTTIQFPIASYHAAFILQGAGHGHIGGAADMGGTILKYTGTGIAIDQTITNVTYQNVPGAKFRDFILSGSGAGAAAIGIQFGGTAQTCFQNVKVSGFNGATAVGIKVKNSSGIFTESIFARDLFLEDNKTNLYFNNSATGGQNSFAHQDMQIWVATTSGQTFMLLDGGGQLINCFFVVNGTIGNTSTGITITGSSSLQASALFWLPEQYLAGGATRFNVADAGSNLSAYGFFNRLDFTDVATGTINLQGGNGDYTHLGVGAANLTNNTAMIYNQTGVGPTISGLALQVRTGAVTPVAALDIDASGNGTFTGNVLGDNLAAAAFLPQGSYTNPTNANATFYNQSGIGPTINGNNIQFRIGATPAEAMRIDINKSVNIGGAAAAVATALLELVSTTKGFLPPRMTTTQRDAISSPAAGLVIYNTTTNKLNVYTTAWEAVTSA